MLYGLSCQDNNLNSRHKNFLKILEFKISQYIISTRKALMILVCKLMIIQK